MDLQPKELCAIFSVVLSSIAFIPYVIETWKIKGGNEVRPTVSGFACWMLSDMAILAAMVARKNIAWQMVPYVAGSFLLIGLSIRKSIKIARMRGEVPSWKDAFTDWGYRDTVCMRIVVAAIAAWGVKRDPDYAIYLTIVSTVIGTCAVAWPLWRDPYRESFLSWVLFLVGGIFGVAAITQWDLAGAIIPILFFGVQGTLVVLLARRFLPRFVVK